jgi:23S rRNA (adenine1618-N6)-methyltransferase
MHPNNIHQNGYDFDVLSRHYPALTPFLTQSTKGKTSIDFANPQAVKCLNAALLSFHYATHFWDIPEGYLCPAVPGRADYIHHIADLLDTQKTTVGLDIGTGANLIYPIIGSQTYKWQFIASDIEKGSFASAKTIIAANPNLKKRIRLRRQNDSTCFFNNILKADEYVDFTMCNPPFHSSLEEALSGNKRKIKGLKHNQHKRGGKQPAFSSNKHSAKLNFGGQNNELWCDGGELKFISNMIKESAEVKTQVGLFTCLVSKSANLPPLLKQLEKIQATNIKQVDMHQGNKTSRFIAWSFSA